MSEEYRLLTLEEVIILCKQGVIFDSGETNRPETITNVYEVNKMMKEAARILTKREEKR